MPAKRRNAVAGFYCAEPVYADANLSAKVSKVRAASNAGGEERGLMLLYALQGQ